MKLPVPFIHWWRRMKWGSDLDCRECLICGRFEIWAFSGYHRAEREDLNDVRPA